MSGNCLCMYIAFFIPWLYFFHDLWSVLWKYNHFYSIFNDHLYIATRKISIFNNPSIHFLKCWSHSGSYWPLKALLDYSFILYALNNFSQFIIISTHRKPIYLQGKYASSSQKGPCQSLNQDFLIFLFFLLNFLSLQQEDRTKSFSPTNLDIEKEKVENCDF